MSTMIQLRRDRTKSGVLRCEDAEVRYFFQPSGLFSLPIAEIALLGEYIVESVPDDLFAEGHFLIFVRRGNGEWLEVPMDAAGHEETLETLSTAWGVTLSARLCGGVGFNSRIMWPPERDGEALFTFDPVQGTGFRSRIKQWLSPEVSRGLSPAALSTLGTEALTCDAI